MPRAALLFVLLTKTAGTCNPDSSIAGNMKFCLDTDSLLKLSCTSGQHLPIFCMYYLQCHLYCNVLVQTIHAID